jgi:hypothetical protein
MSSKAFNHECKSQHFQKVSGTKQGSGALCDKWRCKHCSTPEKPVDIQDNITYLKKHLTVCAVVKAKDPMLQQRAIQALNSASTIKRVQVQNSLSL